MIKSLLQHITLSEIEDIILEDTLSKQGFEFHYFIDNYDIGKYSFPFGLLAGESYDQSSDRSIEVVTDEQIAYHYLFDIRSEKLLLSEEHIVELNDFIGKIKRVERFGLEVVDAFTKQADYFENVVHQKNISFDNWKKLDKVSELQVSLLLSIAIGSLLDGKKKINDLKEKKLILSAEDYQDNFEENPTIFDVKPGETTNLLYDRLIADLGSNISTQRAVSRYEKCKIFDRILHINQQTIPQKQIFLLLSSAKVTNTRLPEIAGELGIFPEHKGLHINPVRSIQQIYLQLLLRDDDNRLGELEKIKSIISFKENADYKDLHYIIDNYILEQFEERLAQLRGKFENTALLLKFTEYDTMLKQALDSQGIKKHKLVAESIKGLIKIAQETQALKKLKAESLDKLQYERDYDLTLKQAVNDINKGEMALEGYTGSDYVANRYHHTPIVFLKQTTDAYKQTLNGIINFIIGLDENTNSKNLIRSINQSFQLIFHNTVPTEEEKIIKILILLMLKNTQDIHPTQLAYDRAKQIYEGELKSDEWKIEFLYILAWISRRLEKYDESLKYAEAGIKMNASDPRFYHALCLVKYCFYEKNNDITALDNSISNAEVATEKYKKIGIKTLPINKSINALLNANAYLKTLKYIHAKDYNLLLDARKDIEQLKFNESSRYHQTSEFLHTEAFLEYHEFKAFNSPAKLKFAKEAIEKAVSLKPQKSYLQLMELITNTSAS